MMPTPVDPPDATTLDEQVAANRDLATITARREAGALRSALDAERQRSKELADGLASAAAARDTMARELSDARRELDDLGAVLDAVRAELDATRHRRSVRLADALAGVVRHVTRPARPGRAGPPPTAPR